MNQEIKEKLAKVYELVNRGVDGEKEAAKAALDRIVKKYGLTDNDVANINKKAYSFKYSTNLELMLLHTLIRYFLDKEVRAHRDTWKKREVVAQLEYVDYVTLECAYEYFRRHMKKQFNKICLPKIKRCRSSKTKNKRREQLQNLFFSSYVIASKLYKEGDLETVDASKMTEKEMRDRAALRNVEGGAYTQQMTTGLYLEQTNN